MGRKRIPEKTPEASTLMKIKLARHRCRMSQREVAQKLGISQQAFSSYERGETAMGLDLLIKLPGIFELSIADLLPDSVVTAVDQRRSKDMRLEELIVGWPDLSDQAKRHLLETFRIVRDTERVHAERGLSPKQKQLV